MLKKLLIVLLIAFLVPFKIYADWVSLDKNKVANTPPQITILSDDNSSTVIKIDVAGFNMNNFVSAGKSYQSVDLMTEMFTTNPGHPELARWHASHSAARDPPGMVQWEGSKDISECACPAVRRSR